jgi:hypothetical protein
MTQINPITYPEILAGDDIARLANRLIAEIAADMLADGARSDEIVYAARPYPHFLGPNLNLMRWRELLP